MTVDGASSISVAVRVRPFTIREAAQLAKVDDGPLFLGDGSLAAAPVPKLQQKGIRSVIKVVDEKCLVFDPPEENPVQRFSKSVVPNGRKVKDQVFGFDRVFDENTSQGDVYEATTRGLLDSVLDGYNATVFAYGATGCGKTHTITGTAQQPGIIFLTMQELFERIQDMQEERVCDISLSYLEIYNETIRDLLNPNGGKQSLMLREDANQAVSVAGLTSHHPQNVQEVMEMILRGNEMRTMSPTEANATSSRSHAVLQINVSSKDRNADVNEPHTMATLSIIDLAGSERASATKNRGERLLEGANINRSLLALGSCINALCDPRKRNHVPYRNSKLTRLLKFSLGGNCKTVMIVCVSPSSAHFDETQNTLRYANRAKNIQTKVTKNVYNVNRHVKDYLKKIDEQRLLIDELKAQLKDHEGAAFMKFQKQTGKRESIAREGIARIRSAYDHSVAERQDRIGMMKRLRQIERRISMISSWISGFDFVTDTREDEEAPKALAAMRKTALGIQAELENSRHHYHQKLAKNNWDRQIETAVQTGIRQLKDLDSSGECPEISSLMKEAELLKSMADREAFTSILDFDRGADATIIQVLLQAHFETVAILNQIMQMDEEEAVEAAKQVLGKIITACCEATSQVIKPEGGLPVPEVFLPTRTGTPKRRKQANLTGPSPMRVTKPSMLEAPHLGSSPVKSSPRRRKVAVTKKVVTFTPKKKSPSKMKRFVRWKDDTEDGQLAEFQATPRAYESSPEKTSSSIEIPSSVFHQLPSIPEPTNSSPIPVPPGTPFEVKPSRASRFQTGFLSKRSESSSSPTPMFSGFHSSDSEHSPLQEIEPNRAPHSQRASASLAIVSTASSDVTPADSCGNSSSSDSEDPHHSWPLDKEGVKKIRSALKRTSSLSNGSHPHPRQRRRSPTAVSAGSPPSEGGMFSASHARRMVKGESGKIEYSVLSPRTAPVIKGSRRMTAGGVPGVEDRGHGVRAGPMRVASASRGSLMPAKTVWR